MILVQVISFKFFVILITRFSWNSMYRHPARIIIIGASSAGRKGDTHIYREMNSDPLRIDSGKNLKNLNFIFRITLLRSGIACK